MKKIILILLSISMLSFNYLSGQTVSQQNAWLMYFGNHKLSNKLGLHTEYQYRRSDFAKDWQQSLLRVGIDYYLPNKSMLTAGYGWIISFPYGEQPIATKVTEHRIFEQFVLQQNIGRVYFHHRYRLEQRIIENAFINSNNEREVDGTKFRQRARYRFLATIPLSHPTLEDNTLFFATYDEVFLGFGEGIGRNILDQNRLYFALGWRFNKDTNVQVGYLNQRVIKSDGDHKENNHTFQLGITHNIDFTKHEITNK